jgi:hypothetical protein
MKKILTVLVTLGVALTMTACDLKVDCSDNGAGNPAQTSQSCQK